MDGVISDDSDSLCYGARTVYRHFSTDPKSFSVSKYCAKRLRKELGNMMPTVDQNDRQVKLFPRSDSLWGLAR